MSQEGFCEKHGPYDAALGRCPYCERERGLPAAPPALDDELPTDPWGGRGRAAGGSDEVTDPRGRAQQYESELDEITDWPKRRGGDWDDEDETQLPGGRRRRGGWEDDETVVERSEKGLLGYLIVKEGMRRGQVQRIRHGTTIGRGDSDILIRDQKVSRLHAKFTVEDNQFFIWDVASDNGTFVNEERIREATALQENDTIKIGDTTFVLKTLE